MTITLAASGTTISLNPDLYWEDEFTWVALEQAISRSVSGALLVQQAARPFGRPITLRNPRSDEGAITRAQLAQLQAWGATPDLALTLTLRGVVHKVIFRHEGDSSPIDAQPLAYNHNSAATDRVFATLRFLTVPE